MKNFSASIWREGEWYVAQCLNIDVVSQGRTREEALTNLKEAVEGVLEVASEEELRERLRETVMIEQFQPSNG